MQIRYQDNNTEALDKEKLYRHCTPCGPKVHRYRGYKIASVDRIESMQLGKKQGHAHNSDIQFNNLVQ